MRLIARYAIDTGNGLEVRTVYDAKSFSIKSDPDDPRIQTIAHEHPAAIWFERKMHDDFGIGIDGAFDNRPLVRHERISRALHPMRKSFTASETAFAPFVPYKYETIRGEGVFEVAVGPIHAGIIEPGHFQFSMAGEDMLHQEVRHFYKYRAIEKMLEGKRLSEAKPIIERISGNESVAYQIAWRDITAQASGIELPDSLLRRHALLLELERLAHHLTDLGFIPNDAGFSAALAFCSSFAEEVRRQMKCWFGHRFGFGTIGFETQILPAEEIKSFMEHLEEEMRWFESWIMDIPSLWDRFDTTGILSHANAAHYDTVGIVARASGIALDVRNNDFYRAHGFSCATEQRGDVAARFKVRVHEVFNSIEMIRNFCDDTEATSVTLPPVSDGIFDAFAESSIGELFMSITIEEGKISRFFARDPSFINWQALHLMMPGNIIADFPLINKSCDLSYAGNDL